MHPIVEYAPREHHQLAIAGDTADVQGHTATWTGRDRMCEQVGCSTVTSHTSLAPPHMGQSHTVDHLIADDMNFYIQYIHAYVRSTECKQYCTWRSGI